MPRRVPPLEAAEAFVAAARARSMRVAADRLALSPSALSRRIQALENFVGTALLVRHSKGLSLTHEGRRYLDLIETVIETLGEATDSLREHGNTLRIAASHTLAAEWLMPRYARMSSELALSLEFIIGDAVAAVKDGRADIALIGGFAPPLGLGSEPLAVGQLSLLSAPDCSGHQRWQELKLARPDYPVLGDSAPEKDWPSSDGKIDFEAILRAPCFAYSTLQMTYEVAAFGMGVALAAPLASERFISSNRLQVCSGVDGRVEVGYWMVKSSAAAHSHRPATLRVESWLATEAQKSLAIYNELTSLN